jgi:tripartite-type tricarboxylate transporter receptor subunit TctC
MRLSQLWAPLVIGIHLGAYRDIRGSIYTLPPGECEAQSSKPREAPMLDRRRFLHLAAASAVLAADAGRAWGQGDPSRPLKILVGFAAGGNFDVVARVMGQWISDRTRQPVVVENRPGASSNIATEAVVRSAADGNTLLMAGAVNAINDALFDNLRFKFASDLAPVAGVVRFPNVLSVGASVPAATLAEFMGYIRANPGKLSQGSSGNGTTQHLAGELFKSMAGVDFLHVPYRGGSQAVSDLLGGQVQLVFEPLAAQLEHIKSGRIRPLAVTTRERSRALPELPTVGEFLPGYEASGWMGLCAPKGTPGDVIGKLNAVVNAGLADAVLKERLDSLGAMPIGGTPDDFARLIADETDKWGRVIKAKNIKAT